MTINQEKEVRTQIFDRQFFFVEGGKSFLREGQEPSQTPKFPAPLVLSPSSLAEERFALGRVAEALLLYPLTEVWQSFAHEPRFSCISRSSLLTSSPKYDKMMQTSNAEAGI